MTEGVTVVVAVAFDDAVDDDDVAVVVAAVVVVVVAAAVDDAVDDDDVGVVGPAVVKEAMADPCLFVCLLLLLSSTIFWELMLHQDFFSNRFPSISSRSSQKSKDRSSRKIHLTFPSSFLVTEIFFFFNSSQLESYFQR